MFEMLSFHISRRINTFMTVSRKIRIFLYNIVWKHYSYFLLMENVIKTHLYIMSERWQNVACHGNIDHLKYKIMDKTITYKKN